MYDATARKPAGHIIIIQPDGPTIEADTLQCVHCEKHWTVIRGSGITRGWCLKCRGPHCGAEACWTCRPADVLIYGGR